MYEALDRLSHPVVPDTLSELDVTLRSLLFPRSVAEVDCQNSACGLEADLASILPGDVRVAGGGVYYLPIPRASLADAGAGDARAEIAADGVIPNSILQALQQEIALSTRAGEYLTQFSRSLRQSQRVFDLGSFGENRLVSISIKRTQRLLEFNDGTLRIVPREDIVTRTETVESIERFFVRAGVAVTTSPSQTFTASRNNAGDVVIGATTDYASIVHPIVMASFDLCGVNPRVTPVHRECQSGNRFQGIRWWWLIPAPSIGFSTTSKIFETLFLGATWSPTNFFSFGAGIQIAQQQRLRQGFLLGDPLNGIELSSVHQGTVVANPYFSFTLSSEVFSAMRGFQQ
ncbi:MAG: hypothetical protein JNK05_30675 [Myxococcales bacterium]|nr:hypothetical protein [Myxococcales bacterium]